MNFKIFILLIIFLNSCTQNNFEKSIKANTITFFSIEGFTLIYNDKDYSEKKISKKLDNRSLLIFQKNLKKKTNVKIINMLNGKSLIAKVSDDSKYPKFYNSVISKRIAKTLDIDIEEPYIKIVEINENSSFIANVAKTYDDEKEVANKAPVEEIEIKNISKIKNEVNEKAKKIKSFSYIIKIADFYYKKTAYSMQNRLSNEFNINTSKINMISKTKYRLFMGPYSNIDDLRTSYYKIEQLDFETIELIKQ
tara:strand:- start:3592 stop:4344 length:753 start_codon:yes stop_codon:yes gene_type:complete